VADGTAPPLRGDEHDLFVAHNDALVRIVGGIVKTSAVVEDACAFAWLQLVATQPDRVRVRPWLVRVATRRAHELEARERRTIADGSILERLSTPPLEVTAGERLAALAALGALAGLRSDEREALALVVGGFDHDEIAARTGASARQVRSRIERARRALDAAGRRL
jgi:RNA polymerase sigma factor (sigma-70 family)